MARAVPAVVTFPAKLVICFILQMVWTHDCSGLGSDDAGEVGAAAGPRVDGAFGRSHLGRV